MLNTSLGSNLSGYGYVFNGFMHLYLNDSISSFLMCFDDKVDFVRSLTDLDIYEKDGMNRLAKEGVLGL